MEQLTSVKSWILGVLGTIGAVISSIFGGWDSALTTLIIFMAIDYITGIIVAAIFHKSGKSENGSLDSRAGFKGLLKKGMILLIVLISYRLDLAIGSTVIKDAVVIAYVANETISIVENAGLMGIPIPSVIRDAIDILKNRSDPDPKDGEDE